jgi:carbon monoxide dehydrogenase subunit G
MKIDSTKVVVAANQEMVASFLKDSQNLIHMLPKDQIADWKATNEECSFKVQGAVVISLIQDGHEGTSKIFMKSGVKSPFPFRLTIHLESQGDSTNGYIAFDGEVNIFLKMMVEKPLTALFNIMSENLKKHFDQQQ